MGKKEVLAVLNAKVSQAQQDIDQMASLWDSVFAENAPNANGDTVSADILFDILAEEANGLMQDISAILETHTEDRQ
ncbi:MAG: hypothetical protein HOO93_10260 [Methyloglobulus sp.]|nr:hypothetical protein [Methyloglobulus sp.]